MGESAPASVAWEPVTPRGVAAFARASTMRLWVVQFVVALGVALSVGWFLRSAWYPPVRQAIQQLPDRGEIRAGRLDWQGISPRRLGEGTYLAVSVDLEHAGEFRSAAHLEIVLGRKSVRVRSLLGFVELPYPQGWVIAVNRVTLGPWWGAWGPIFLLISMLAVIAWLLVVWAVLAALYAPPLWLLAFFVNRDLSWAASWRLAGAALLPGALLMAAGILMYGLGIVDLVGLGFIAAGHLVLGWVYLFLAPLFLARSDAGKGSDQNPFKPPPAQG